MKVIITICYKGLGAMKCYTIRLLISIKIANHSGKLVETWPIPSTLEISKYINRNRRIIIL